MTQDAYPYLNLKAWPFHVVASPGTAGIWVARPEFEKRLRTLQRSAKRIPTSQIVILWATFGSGKTHALLHLQQLVASDPDVAALYVVTPKGITSFVQIYQAIMDAALKSGLIHETGRAFFEEGAGRADSDLERALLRIGMYEGENAATAISWLRGERVRVTELRQIGIGGRIETSIDAVDALNQLVTIIRRTGHSRIMLLLDEVQELEEVGKKLAECVGGLHKVFDQNPEGLTIVLSFTTGNQGSVRAILGETLYDRASRPLTLPDMGADESAHFIEELITAYSIDSSRSPFPFSREAVRAVVAHLETSQIPLTPRALIKVFNEVLQEHELEIEDGELGVIGPEEVLSVLGPDES